VQWDPVQLIMEGEVDATSRRNGLLSHQLSLLQEMLQAGDGALQLYCWEAGSQLGGQSASRRGDYRQQRRSGWVLLTCYWEARGGQQLLSTVGVPSAAHPLCVGELGGGCAGVDPVGGVREWGAGAPSRRRACCEPPVLSC
jgi:hypothetical protein